MRVLFTAIWPTHLMPMVPLAWALRAAGHEVLVAGDADVALAGTRAGLSAAEIVGVPPGGTGAAPSVADRTRRRVDTYLAGYRETADTWRPDLIVTDPLEWNALILGGLLDIPVVHVRFGPGDLPDTAFRVAAEALRDTCAELGLVDGLPEPDLIADPCPPGLQTPGLRPARQVRYVPYNGPGSFHPELLTSPARRRVLVLFSVDGLEKEPVLALMKNLLRGCDRLPGTETLVAASSWLRESLRESESYGSVRVIDPVPIQSLLYDCDLVVHHGGHGTASTAAAYGVPQAVVVPPLPEGPRHSLLVDCAERVRAFGAGRWLDDPQTLATPDGIAAALAEALDEPAYRDRANRLCTGIDALPTPADLVGTLEQLCTEDAGAHTRRGHLAHSPDADGSADLGAALGRA